MDMARIRRRGLGYFPYDTNFFNDRKVRRLMKSAGDTAVAVLQPLLCNLYGGESYYLLADDDYVEDMADQVFYQLSPAYVRQVIEELVRLGFFDAGLYARHRVLTSEEIQRQYLFCMKQKDMRLIDERFRLVSEPEPLPGDAKAQKRAVLADKMPKTGMQGTENSDLIPENSGNARRDAQKKEKQMKEKQTTTKESAAQQGTAAAGGRPAAREEDEPLGKCEALAPQPDARTFDDVYRLKPPADGVPRNLRGLLLNMSLYDIPPAEQYAIILKSDYGRIGHPVWQGFDPLRSGRCKIREPGKFLLSLCRDMR